MTSYNLASRLKMTLILIRAPIHKIFVTGIKMDKVSKLNSAVAYVIIMTYVSNALM